MKRLVARLTPCAALVLLTACGGGGGSGSEAVTRAVPGVNGLDFGFPGQRLEQVETVEVTARAAEFVSDSRALIVDQTVTLGRGSIMQTTGQGVNGTATIFGREVTITDGSGTLAAGGGSPGGEFVQIERDPGEDGSFVAAVSFVSSDIAENGGFEGENHFVIGFETNPAEVAALAQNTSGEIVFGGGFFVGARAEVNGGDPVSDIGVDGTATVTANFADGMVNTVLDGSYIAPGDTNVDIVLETGPTLIDGNSFGGDLTCLSGCVSDASDLEGAFYGPDAVEAAGVIALNIVSDVSMDEIALTGAGTFIADR